MSIDNDTQGGPGAAASAAKALGRPAPRGEAAPAPLEARIAEVGAGLGAALAELLAKIPGGPHTPGRLAQVLGLDKVLTSRLLKCLRQGDPMAVIHHAPGPEPLRRLGRAARKAGIEKDALAAVDAAIEDFDHLIKVEIGDRSALGAIISAWLPEARQEFELRRKQAAFKAMSELKGASIEKSLSAVFLHPSADGERIDVVWLMGYLGIRRIRPGAHVRFVTRRVVPDGAHRRPMTLEGEAVDGLIRARLDRFCVAPPAEVEAHTFGEVVHYTLSGNGFGPGSNRDLVLAEVNLAEMPRYVPVGSGRKGYVFVEIVSPTRALTFDVFVHEDLYPAKDPELIVYDTAHGGFADVNDRSRDMDRLETVENVQHLGRGMDQVRIAEVPNYVDMVREVYSRLSWDPARFRAYRCRQAFPLYGTEVAVAFEPPEK